MSLDIVTLPQGVPRTLRTNCCGSGEVFQQKQGFSCQGSGKHTPEELQDGHNQELVLPILLPASGCEQPARGSSGAPGAPCFQRFSILTALPDSGQFLLPGCCFPDPGSQVGKIGKTDVRKALSLLAPSEVRYPAGLAGVIKSRVIIYPRASLASHVPRSKSGITLPTETDSHGYEGEHSLPLRVLIHL